MTVLSFSYRHHAVLTYSAEMDVPEDVIARGRVAVETYLRRNIDDAPGDEATTLTHTNLEHIERDSICVHMEDPKKGKA